MICGQDCNWYRPGGSCFKTKTGFTNYMTKCDDLECFTPKDKIMEDKNVNHTKTCKVCGEEKPFEDFQKTKTGVYSSTCKKCMSAKIAQAKAEKAAAKTTEKQPKSTEKQPNVNDNGNVKEEVKPVPGKKAPGLSIYSDVEIIDELKKRGYAGTLTLSILI